MYCTRFWAKSYLRRPFRVSPETRTSLPSCQSSEGHVRCQLRWPKANAQVKSSTTKSGILRTSKRCIGTRSWLFVFQNRMTKLIALSLQILFIVRVWHNFYRDVFDNFQSIPHE